MKSDRRLIDEMKSRNKKAAVAGLMYFFVPDHRI